MRRIFAVVLMILMGTLLGRVKGQATDSLPTPVTTQEVSFDILTTPEIILTVESQPTETASPTITPILSPTLPTAEATIEAPVAPVQDEIIAASIPVIPGITWDLSVRELFDVMPVSPWLIPPSWTVDANQRLLVGNNASQTTSLPSARYGAVLGDVQAQATFFLNEGDTVSLAVRVSDMGAYRAELDATGFVRLGRADEVVAETVLSLETTDSHILNVMALGSTVTVRVDDTLVLTYTDLSPLAAGAVAFGGQSLNIPFAIDDVFIWRPEADPSNITTVPTLPVLPADVLPLHTSEPKVILTEESLPASAEVRAQALQLELDTPRTYTIDASQQQTWEYTLPEGGNTDYYIEIKRVSGNGKIDLYSLINSATDKIAFGSPYGGSMLWLSHPTGGTKSLLTAAQDITPPTTFEITIHSCCKPLLAFDEYAYAGYIYSFSGPGVARWAYELTTPTNHFLDWFRLEGNLSYHYSIRNRQTTQVVAEGNVLVDNAQTTYSETAMYVPSSTVGWYDVELTLLKTIGTNNWSQGAYALGLFTGNPYPSKPANFVVSQRGATSLSFTWDADIRGNTEYFVLLRKPYVGASYYIDAEDSDIVDSETLTITDTGLACNTTYEYALMAYNWASPSTDDGDYGNPEDPDDPNWDDIEAEDMFSLPITATTKGCPPPNDIRWNSTLLTTLPWDHTYLSDVTPISSAEDTQGDPLLLSCASGGYSASIWYRYNTSAPVILNVTTAGSTYNTVVVLYQNINGQLVERACHDDVEPDDILTSQAIYETGANQQFYILVAQVGPDLPEPTAVAQVHVSLLTKLPAPTLQTPVNLGVTNGLMTWNSVTNAASYHLQISAASTFANRLIDQYLPSPSFDTTPENSDPTLPDGKYFWRVRTITAEGLAGGWSLIWSFTKDTVAPKKPTITTPALNVVFMTLRPSFTASLAAVEGARRYEWQIATDEFFTQQSIVPTFPASTPTTILTLTQSLAQGQYYARVLACDAAGNCGDYSDPRPFQIDLRQLPANNAPVIVTGPTSAALFRWALPQGVTNFTLQVSTDNTFIPPLDYSKEFVVPPAAPLFWTIPNVGSELGNGAFYWRLLLTGPNLPDSLTIPRRFIVTPPLPVAPKLIAQPNAGILNTKAITLEWQAVVYAYAGVPYNVSYEVQVDNLSSFASPEYTSPSLISGLMHTTSELPSDGFYYIRVRAVNEFGALGAWSAVQRVTIDTADPVPPTITLPTLNAWTSSARPLSAWKPAAGATYYRVQYSTTSAFNLSDIVIDVETRAAAYTPTVSLAQGRYYVRVANRDAALNWSDDSIPIPFNFIMNTAPLTSGNLIPLLVSGTINPLFRWASVPGATQYQVVVARDATCTTDAVKSPILGPTGFAWTYGKDADGNTPPPLGYGVYYWCVAVNRGPGTPGAVVFPNTLEMPPQGFRLNITPAVPPAVLIEYPATVLPVATAQPIIRWTPISASIPHGPFTYEVQVDDSLLFNLPEFGPDPTIAPLSSTSITTSTLADGKHNLRVRAINSAGGVGPWSVVRVFTVDTILPRKPAVLRPTQDSTFSGLIPTITWEWIPDAVQYRVHMSQTSGFDPVYEWQGRVTAMVLPFALLNQTYYVRVQSIDAAGNASVWSDVRVFNVQWPATQAPIPVYYTTNTPTLIWENITWATRYEVQVSANSTFTQIVATAIKDNTLPANMTTFDLPPRVDGIYYWRVRAGLGTLWFAWSDVITFAVDS